ncbi:MAG: hypothetical protein AAGA20_21580 [Planctomycetota bacterium]
MLRLIITLAAIAVALAGCRTPDAPLASDVSDVCDDCTRISIARQAIYEGDFERARRAVDAIEGTDRAHGACAHDLTCVLDAVDSITFGDAEGALAAVADVEDERA